MSNILPSVTLVLGGQRSGKSGYAEGLMCSGQKALYLATAQALDMEMIERVRIHKNRRDGNWKTVEEPYDLASALLMHDKSGRPILIDSLGMWISNLLAYEKDVDEQIRCLIETLENIKSSLVLVSDEVGQGVIPDNALARQFIDKLGALNQLLADRADVVIFVTAGLALYFKR